MKDFTAKLQMGVKPIRTYVAVNLYDTFDHRLVPIVVFPHRVPSLWKI